MLEGDFTADKAESFVLPLSDIIKVGVKSIVFDVDSKSLKISTKTSTESNIILVNYERSLFEGFELPASPFSVGILNLSELYGIMRIFKDGFRIKMTPEMVTLTQKENKFIYYGIHHSKCNRGPKAFNPSQTPLVKFKWTSELDAFMKASNQLNEHKHIVLSASKGDTAIELSVTNNQFKRYNTFKANVDSTDIDENIKIVVGKEFFQPVVSGSVRDFDVSILQGMGQKMLVFQGTTDYFSIIHAVAPKNKS